MATEPIRNEQEARELLRRLERFYGQPVPPLHQFCDAIELWMDCIARNNTDPALVDGDSRHGRKYFEFLRSIRIDIRKSNLLGRLLYAGEPLRTRMCPLHKGHYDGDAMFFHKCPHKCDGTGWLRERETDGGYTGISVREAKIEDGQLEVRDPDTGE